MLSSTVSIRPVLLNIVLVITTITILFHTSSYVFADTILQIILYEINARRNFQHRNSRIERNLDRDKTCETSKDSSRQQGPGFVACVIAYREDSVTLERCIKSYLDSIKSRRCRVFVLGIDGNEHDDMSMFEVLRKIFGTDSTKLVKFDEPLGAQAELYYRQHRDRDQSTKQAGERDEFEESVLKALYSAVGQTLRSARGHSATELTDDRCIAVCLTQPHVGIKEIRFATWFVSMVLAGSIGVEFLWSSDSDSFTQPGVIDLAFNSISDHPNVGAASVALAVCNRNASFISRLCASHFRSHIYLDKACLAAMGQSTVITGPSALFRTKALMQVILPWYRQRILGHKTDINEDAHIATQLGLHGWERHYISDAIVLTEAKTTLMSWLKQQIRWQRSGHLERIYNPLYTCTQGPLFLWWRTREASLGTLWFAEILSYAITGSFLLPNISGQLAVSAVALSVYNTLRSPERSKDFLILPLSIVFHAFTMPFAHVWAACTVFESSWGKTDRAVSSAGIRAPGGLSPVHLGSAIWALLVVSFITRFMITVVGGGVG